MKLTKLILSIFSATAFCSCSAVYETDNICQQGADVRLTFRKNMQGEDLFSSEVHCSKILLYDGEGRFYDDITLPEDGRLNIDLPLGNYHAIAYGGMSCENADIEFSANPKTGDHYSDIMTQLKDTRATQVAKNIHSHFHGTADFAVTMEDMDYVPVNIDLTKNNNRFRVNLRYSDGSEIDADDFNFTVAADNAVAAHDNSIIPQGTDVVYAPYEKGESDGTAWAEISLPRLMANGEARLKVTRTNADEPVVDLEILQYLSSIKEKEMQGASFQEYLDKCDSWTLVFILDPESDKFAGLSFTINNWEVRLNIFDL